MGKHEDKALKHILQGREVEKKIQVSGYDKEFSEKMKKEREEERRASEALSKTMSEVRMPMFCPKCSGLMTKRLDKKFWMKGYKSCFSCVQKEEHKIRLKGPDAWREYEQKKVRENALSWLRDQEQEFKAWKEYENKKVRANAMSWLRDQEQGFKEWKEMVLNPKKEIVNEDGSLEKWQGNLKENKKIVKNMEKEFKEMKEQLLSELNIK